MKTILMLTLTAALAAPLAAATFDHAPWDRVLKAHVNAIGEVDYAAIKANRKGLDDYVARMGAVSPANKPELFPSRGHELAYWINAYNALVTRGVVDKYPTKSVRDLGLLYGFFRRKDYVLGGEQLSLQTLENDIIRKKYDEPRIHFAIVCASLSCPKLSRDAYTAENLEEQLERHTRIWFNERRNLLVDAKANTIGLGAILDWYRKDFEPGGSTLLDYVKRYASAENRRAIEGLKNPKIRFHEYDWAINDPGSRARAKSPLERELAQPPSGGASRGL